MDLARLARHRELCQARPWALDKWQCPSACKSQHARRTEAQNRFQTSCHQVLVWKWPNKILPQAWPASGLFKSKFPVQPTEYSLAILPIFGFFLFFLFSELSLFMGCSSVLCSMIGIGHVPLVRTTKFIFFAENHFHSSSWRFHFLFIRSENSALLSNRCSFLTAHSLL